LGPAPPSLFGCKVFPFIFDGTPAPAHLQGTHTPGLSPRGHAMQFMNLPGRPAAPGLGSQADVGTATWEGGASFWCVRLVTIFEARGRRGKMRFDNQHVNLRAMDRRNMLVPAAFYLFSSLGLSPPHVSSLPPPNPPPQWTPRSPSTWRSCGPRPQVAHRCARWVSVTATTEIVIWFAECLP